MTNTHLTAFQPNAFQNNAFQIYDQTHIDDGITTTFAPLSFITAGLTILPGDELVTTPRTSNRQITA